MGRGFQLTLGKQQVASSYRGNQGTQIEPKVSRPGIKPDTVLLQGSASQHCSTVSPLMSCGVYQQTCSWDQVKSELSHDVYVMR